MTTTDRVFRFGAGTVTAERVRGGELADAYPAGANDLELRVSGDVTAAELGEASRAALEEAPRCRRVVLAVPERDLAAIGWAEDAGFRYVVDVELRSGGRSLLVSEPQWVLDQPHILEDIPLKE